MDDGPEASALCFSPVPMSEAEEVCEPWHCCSQEAEWYLVRNTRTTHGAQELAPVALVQLASISHYGNELPVASLGTHSTRGFPPFPFPREFSKLI